MEGLRRFDNAFPNEYNRAVRPIEIPGALRCFFSLNEGGSRMKKRLFALLLFLLIILPLFAAAEGELRGYDKKAGYVYVTLGRYYQHVDTGNAKIDGGEPEKRSWAWNANLVKGENSYTSALDPILWRVLTVDDEKAYLASEYVLFAHPMHVDYNEYAKIGGDFGATELSAYLNHDFADVAFTDEEMEMLLPKLTYGKVFLLEGADLKNKEIGMGQGKGMKCWGTEYAIRVTGVYVFAQSNGAHSAYWVMDQSTTDKRHARCTKHAGELGHIVSDRDNEGVRPALYLKMDSFEIAGGAGTKDDPYQLLPRQNP